MENFGWLLHCSDLCCIDSNLSSKCNCRAVSISMSAFKKKDTNILIIQWRNVSFNTACFIICLVLLGQENNLPLVDPEYLLKKYLCVNATRVDVFTQKTQHSVAVALSYPDQTFWRSYAPFVLPVISIHRIPVYYLCLQWIYLFIQKWWQSLDVPLWSNKSWI